MILDEMIQWKGMREDKKTLHPIAAPFEKQRHKPMSMPKQQKWGRYKPLKEVGRE